MTRPVAALAVMPDTTAHAAEAGLSGGATALYRLLVMLADSNGIVAPISATGLEAETRYTRRAVRGYLEDLAAAGLAAVDLRQGHHGRVELLRYHDVRWTVDRPALRARSAGLFLAHVDRSAIWSRDQGICHLCGDAADPEQWQVDHVIPLALLGPHDPRNAAVSHPRCNQAKRARACSGVPRRWAEALEAYVELHGHPFVGDGR